MKKGQNIFPEISAKNALNSLKKQNFHHLQSPNGAQAAKNSTGFRLQKQILPY